jgi:hypothetical protein
MFETACKPQADSAIRSRRSAHERDLQAFGRTELRVQLVIRLASKPFHSYANSFVLASDGGRSQNCPGCGRLIVRQNVPQ